MSKPIINFSEATYLALHAMALMADSSESLSIHVMAVRLGVSEAHLAKVVQWLARSGLVNTTRGPKGGVTLAKSPKETTFLEIFRAIEGNPQPAGCVFGCSECPLPKCIFGEFLTKITADTEEWLKSNTLENFQTQSNPEEGLNSEKSHKN